MCLSIVEWRTMERARPKIADREESHNFNIILYLVLFPFVSKLYTQL